LNLQVILAAFISAGVMLVLSSAVAFLNSLHLATYFQLFCVLQDLAVVGASGAKNAPMYREELVTVFRYASLLNFDIGVLKPGFSGIPSFSFVDKFVFTLAAVAFTAGMFALAAFLRSRFRLEKARKTVQQARTFEQLAELQRNVSTSNLHVEAETRPATVEEAKTGGHGASKRASYLRRDSALSPVHVSVLQRAGAWTAFRRRFQHALIILLCIFYLRITILQIHVSLTPYNAARTARWSGMRIRCAHLRSPSSLLCLC